MKRLSALLLASALGALTGCATTATTTAAVPVVASHRGGLGALASGHDHVVRAAATTAVDAPRTLDGAPEGIPLPEPALPARDVHLAGPTPQIPIPRGGGLAIPVN